MCTITVSEVYRDALREASFIYQVEEYDITKSEPLSNLPGDVLSAKRYVICKLYHYKPFLEPSYYVGVHSNTVKQWLAQEEVPE